MQITLPKSRLVDGRDMSIALGVFPYPHQPLPERRNEVKEGFFTSLAADELTRATVFFTRSQHLIAVALFLLVGLFLWWGYNKVLLFKARSKRGGHHAGPVISFVPRFLRRGSAKEYEPLGRHEV